METEDGRRAVKAQKLTRALLEGVHRNDVASCLVLKHSCLSVPERSEGTEVSKMAIREGAVFWGVWGVSPHYRA